LISDRVKGGSRYEVSGAAK